jgi:hypothetical protein
MEKQREIAVAERESKGLPFTIPALLMRIVGVPIYGGWLVFCIEYQQTLFKVFQRIGMTVRENVK